jgi:MoaA/NifB/PqqE/SkfB family radical SAM enzyme
MTTKRFPVSVCVRLTRRCNARCGFCQAPDTDHHTISGVEFGHLCAWVASQGVRSVKLSGGEPTVRRDLNSLVETVRGSGMRPTVITNGISLRDDVIAALVRTRGELKVSIHHPSQANDLVLGRASFEAVLGNVRAARRAGVACGINTVVNKANYRELERLTEMAASLRCRKITFIPFVPRGRGRDRRDIFELTDEQLRWVEGEIRRLTQTRPGSIEVRCIDLRSKPYWVVENDMRLMEESWTEDHDRLVLSAEALRRQLSRLGASAEAAVSHDLSGKVNHGQGVWAG